MATLTPDTSNDSFEPSHADDVCGLMGEIGIQVSTHAMRTRIFHF